jgi:hypothetical protein
MISNFSCLCAVLQLSFDWLGVTSVAVRFRELRSRQPTCSHTSLAPHTILKPHVCIIRATATPLPTLTWTSKFVMQYCCNYSKPPFSTPPQHRHPLRTVQVSFMSPSSHFLLLNFRLFQLLSLFSFPFLSLILTPILQRLNKQQDQTFLVLSAVLSTTNLK